MDDNEFAVAESVKALLAEYADHVHYVEQQIARDGLAENRAQFQARKLETRRKIIVGGAALAEARTNPKFGAELYEMLARRVTDDRDRQLIAFGPSSQAQPQHAGGPPEGAFTAEAERRLAAALEPGDKVKEGARGSAPRLPGILDQR